MIAVPLAACDPSELPENARIPLPAAPPDLKACFQRNFPDIPDRVLTKGDIVRIVGEAKILDRAKSACGARAVAWIEGVRREYARAGR